MILTLLTVHGDIVQQIAINISSMSDLYLKI